jgi:hypothetical protein
LSVTTVPFLQTIKRRILIPLQIITKRRGFPMVTSYKYLYVPESTANSAPCSLSTRINFIYTHRHRSLNAKRPETPGRCFENRINL